MTYAARQDPARTISANGDLGPATARAGAAQVRLTPGPPDTTAAGGLRAVVGEVAARPGISVTIDLAAAGDAQELTLCVLLSRATVKMYAAGSTLTFAHPPRHLDAVVMASPVPVQHGQPAPPGPAATQAIQVSALPPDFGQPPHGTRPLPPPAAAAVHEDAYPVHWAGRQALVALPEHIDVSNTGQIREELLWVINRGTELRLVVTAQIVRLLCPQLWQISPGGIA
jgi:hypothetical protein